jgi:hypothetical protein
MTDDRPRNGKKTPPAEQAVLRAPRRLRGQWLGLVLAALVGATVAGVVMFVMRPTPAPSPVERPLEAPAVVPEPRGEAPPPASPAPVPSRSRGRTDWLFFFKPGDRLVRMGDETPLGMVVRVDRAQTFPDGTTGPAYLLQMPEGGQRFVDADELERGARLQ